MFNVGGPEMLVILLVALIVLGPDQLPKAARRSARSWPRSAGVQRLPARAAPAALEARQERKTEHRVKPQSAGWPPTGRLGRPPRRRRRRTPPAPADDAAADESGRAAVTRPPSETRPTEHGDRVGRGEPHDAHRAPHRAAQPAHQDRLAVASAP